MKITETPERRGGAVCFIKASYVHQREAGDKQEQWRSFLTCCAPGNGDLRHVADAEALHRVVDRPLLFGCSG